jgi:hypothetical protein
VLVSLYLIGVYAPQLVGVFFVHYLPEGPAVPVKSPAQFGVSGGQAGALVQPWHCTAAQGPWSHRVEFYR